MKAYRVHCESLLAPAAVFDFLIPAGDMLNAVQRANAELLTMKPGGNFEIIYVEKCRELYIP